MPDPTPELPLVYPLGPGVLKIGATGSLVDYACLLNSATIAASKDQTDDTTKLCGRKRRGSITYTYALSGNADLDLHDAAGLFRLSQEHAGEELSYEFTPSTAAGVKAVGKLTIDPLDLGGDTTGETMTSDFEFALSDKPTYSWPVA